MPLFSGCANALSLQVCGALPDNVFGMVVQVVSKSDEANQQYEYAWVWAAWMDTAPNDALTAPRTESGRGYAEETESR